MTIISFTNTSKTLNHFSLRDNIAHDMKSKEEGKDEATHNNNHYLYVNNQVISYWPS